MGGREGDTGSCVSGWCPLCCRVRRGGEVMTRVRGRGTRGSERHFLQLWKREQMQNLLIRRSSDASAAFALKTLRNLLRLNKGGVGGGGCDFTATPIAQLFNCFNQSRLLSSDGEPALPTALSFCIGSRRWFYSQGDIDNSLKVLDDLKFNSP